MIAEPLLYIGIVLVTPGAVIGTGIVVSEFLEAVGRIVGGQR